jgi:hypothetical protein
MEFKTRQIFKMKKTVVFLMMLLLACPFFSQVKIATDAGTKQGYGICPPVHGFRFNDMPKAREYVSTCRGMGIDDGSRGSIAKPVETINNKQ